MVFCTVITEDCIDYVTCTGYSIYNMSACTNEISSEFNSSMNLSCPTIQSMLALMELIASINAALLSSLCWIEHTFPLSTNEELSLKHLSKKVASLMALVKASSTECQIPYV